jgi:hypothetical protein
MSLFGIDFFDASGNLILSSTDMTWSYVGFITVVASESKTEAFPAAAGMVLMTQQWLPNVVPTDQEAYTHIVSVAGNSVIVDGTNATVTTNILVLAQ